MNPRQVPLVDGPLKGQVHELWGSIMPAGAGLSDEDTNDPKELHWYSFHEGKGYYLHTERKHMPGLSEQQIDHFFKYHAPHGNQVARYAALRQAAKMFALKIKNLTPDSAEQTMAIRKVQEAVMWANASLAVNEKASDEPQGEDKSEPA